MSDAIKPLHGTKTHALSSRALNDLRSLLKGPVPSQTINPGVVNRLMRGGLIEIVYRESPYKIHRGAKISFVQITDLGKAQAND